MVTTRRRFAWIRRRPRTTAAVLIATALILMNGLAYRHARAMTHYAPAGSRTGRPEQLSLFRKLVILGSGVSIPRPGDNGRTPARDGLSFEVHRITAPGGVELEAWFVGHPLPKGLVLLFHGYAACKADLIGEAKAFHDLGYAALLVDFRGSGGSNGSDTTIGVREAEDVCLAAEFARSRWGELPQIFYGQSMGSAALLRAVAVHGERPVAVIMECPFDRLLATVGNRFHAMGLPAFPGAHLLLFWGGVQQGFNGFRHNPAEYAAQVSCPVLHLHGADDPRVTREQAQAVFDNLAGEKQMELFDGVGHTAYLLEQPERWRRVVGEFLRRHADGHSRGKQ